jgi:exonuclease VII large subunit
MATTKKRKTVISSVKSDKENQPEISTPVLDSIEKSLSEYLKTINGIYQQAMGDYEKLVSMFNEKVQQHTTELNKEKHETADQINDSFREAWRKNDSASITDVQNMSVKSSTEIQQKETKVSIDLYTDLTENINQLNKDVKKAFSDAFIKYNKDLSRKWSDIEIKTMTANSLYKLGYIQMTSAWVGFLTTGQ